MPQSCSPYSLNYVFIEKMIVTKLHIFYCRTKNENETNHSKKLDYCNIIKFNNIILWIIGILEICCFQVLHTAQFTYHAGFSIIKSHIFSWAMFQNHPWSSIKLSWNGQLNRNTEPDPRQRFRIVRVQPSIRFENSSSPW